MNGIVLKQSDTGGSAVSWSLVADCNASVHTHHSIPWPIPQIYCALASLQQGSVRTFNGSHSIKNNAALEQGEPFWGAPVEPHFKSVGLCLQPGEADGCERKRKETEGRMEGKSDAGIAERPSAVNQHLFSIWTLKYLGLQSAQTSTSTWKYYSSIWHWCLETWLKMLSDFKFLYEEILVIMLCV